MNVTISSLHRLSQHSQTPAPVLATDYDHNPAEDVQLRPASRAMADGFTQSPTKLYCTDLSGLHTEDPATDVFITEDKTS